MIVFCYIQRSKYLLEIFPVRFLLWTLRHNNIDVGMRALSDPNKFEPIGSKTVPTPLLLGYYFCIKQIRRDTNEN